MTRLKTFLLMLAVVGLCAGTALAATTNVTVKLVPNRDNDNNSAGGSHPGEWHSNEGGAGAVRIKASDHQYYADWDQVPQLGKVNDNAGGYAVSYTMNVVPHCCGWSDSGASTPMYIASMWSENDWVEANGPQNYVNYNWSNPTTEYAATYMYAQDMEDPLNPGSSDPSAVVWTFPGNTGVDPNYVQFVDCTFLETFIHGGDKRAGGFWQPWVGEVKTIKNTENYVIAWFDEGTYVTVNLDQAIVDDLLTNDNNRGLVFYNLPPKDVEGNDDFFNKNVRTREYGGFEPYLEATIADVHIGDGNLDGCVDGLDYVSWSNNYNLDPSSWPEGDYNQDGKTDGLDYVAWSNNYQAGCPGLPGAVPEPATMALLAMGALALVRRRR